MHGVGRIAIVDWDVHHGNGTQWAFYDDARTLTISIHQDGRFPTDTGALDERGDGDGFGANVNVPLMPGCGHGAYVAAFERVVVPALDRFRPELLIVASGYDAGGFDAMAHMMCHSGTFASMASMMVAVADRHAAGRLVVLHEGGYSPFHVPFCGLAVIEQLTGEPSGVADPYATLANLPYQALQPHQSDADRSGRGAGRRRARLTSGVRPISSIVATGEPVATCDEIGLTPTRRTRHSTYSSLPRLTTI